MSEPRYWAELTTPQIKVASEAGDTVVFIPVGAVEQHGPHLPVDTDICGAHETTKEIARRRSYALVAPPVSWGVSGAHRKFPGVLTLRVSTFTALLEDLCDSIVDQGFTKIALIIGHATNKPIVQTFVGQYMERRNISLLQINYVNLAAERFTEIRKSALGGAAHAGELETALQMHFRPGMIDLTDVPVHYLDAKRDFGLSGATKDMFKAGEAIVGYDLAQSFPDGVMGDPSVATEETGRQLFEAIVEKACAICDEYQAL
ncbi:MAG: creatininase family protein [Gaiellaceae bacterium]